MKTDPFFEGWCIGFATGLLVGIVLFVVLSHPGLMGNPWP